jgi:peptidoglycan/LPS O-acetylase OafA/YrhL
MVELMCVAYSFAGPVRAFNRLRDYSYGIYILAYPVQQALACLIHGISVAKLIVMSSGITLALAILSWHLIEKRALAMKAACAVRTRAWIETRLPRKRASQRSQTLES